MFFKCCLLLYSCSQILLLKLDFTLSYWKWHPYFVLNTFSSLHSVYVSSSNSLICYFIFSLPIKITIQILAFMICTMLKILFGWIWKKEKKNLCRMNLILKEENKKFLKIMLFFSSIHLFYLFLPTYVSVLYVHQWFCNLTMKIFIFQNSFLLCQYFSFSG